MPEIDDRVKRATDRFEALRYTNTASSWVVQEILKAADEPDPPKWPTDESVKALTKAANTTGSWHSHEGRRVALRAALLDDPIIKAAMRLRGHERSYSGGASGAVKAIGTPYAALLEAVDEAGL